MTTTNGEARRDTPRIPYLTRWLINRYVEYVATDRLSTIFSALADPTRRAILARLMEGEATVTELAEPFEIACRRSRGT